MRLALWHRFYRSRRNVPVIDRLERRTLLSVSHAGVAAVAAHPKTKFPVSDIFGAAAGVAIWQNGSPVVAGSSTGVGGNVNGASATIFQPAQAGNNLLLANATVPGANAIFSVLPVLPPDGLAAEIIGLIDPLHGYSAVFRGS